MAHISLECELLSVITTNDEKIYTTIVAPDDAAGEYYFSDTIVIVAKMIVASDTSVHAGSPEYTTNITHHSTNHADFSLMSDSSLSAAFRVSRTDRILGLVLFITNTNGLRYYGRVKNYGSGILPNSMRVNIVNTVIAGTNVTMTAIINGTPSEANVLAVFDDPGNPTHFQQESIAVTVTLISSLNYNFSFTLPTEMLDADHVTSTMHISGEVGVNGVKSSAFINLDVYLNL